MEGMLVEKEGLFDTIQDLGRWGYQAYGMVVSGAMDPYAYQLGNILLGNDRSAASLEMTLFGPKLRFSAPTIIALTGANCNPLLNGETIPMWEVIEINENDLLTIGATTHGSRSYLAIAGGFQVDQVLGSRSTYSKGNFGGFKGRALQKGDVIPYLTQENKHNHQRKYRLSHLLHSTYKHQEKETILRIVLGPQESYFADKGLEHFLSESYSVSAQMDRMGIRLEGSPLSLQGGADILSEATAFGAIQVPANGQPIILMADRQTTGGYPKIGTIISVDLPKAAQLRSKQQVCFRAVTIEEAQQLLLKQERLFTQLNILLNS